MRRLAALFASALLLAACGTESNLEPPAPLVKFTPQVDVREAWSTDVGAGADEKLFGLVPASDGQRVFSAGRDGSVSAYRVSDGHRLWRADTDRKLGGGPGADDVLVAVGTSDGYVVAFDAKDGHKLWDHDVDSEVIAAPAVDDEAIVVRTGDGHLVALSPADGHELWRLARDVPQLSLRGNAAPVIHGSVVYAGFDDGTLVAARLRDGHQLWATPVAAPAGATELQNLDDVDGTPVVALGIAYVTAYHGNITALTADAGQALWETGLSSYTGVSQSGDRVFVTDSNSVVHAFNAASGDEVWKQAAMRARFLTRPTPFHGTVAAADFEGYVHFLSQKDGSLVARVRVDSDGVQSAPVTAGDTLLVLSNGGELAAYRFPAAKGS